jgi:hypothetical protein
MRILHTSDGHLGRQFHNVSLLDDQRLALAQIIEIVRIHRVDVHQARNDSLKVSRDVEALHLAIRTLIDLQATGRIIEIISHVAELKEQMPLRLDVIADRDGSRVKLVRA